jgi:flagellar hook-associated protein 1 FlgK
MSLSAALYSSLSSLNTLQQQTRLVSANVANAQSPEYTRKIANLVTPAVQGLPTGVSIQSITRTVSTTLQAELLARTADSAAEEVRAAYLDRIGNILDVDAGEPAITERLQAFQQAWTDFEASPENPNLSRNIVIQGQQLATSINQLAATPPQIDTQILTDIGTNLTLLNSLVGQAYSLNTQLVTQGSTGQPIGDLQDQMDTVVRQMSKLAKVQVLSTGTAAVQIITTGGLSLVSGAVQPVFSFDANTNQVQTTSNGITTAIPSTAFQSGQVDALIKLRSGFGDTSTFSQTVMTSTNPADGALRKFVNQIDQMANQIAAVTNNAYNKSNSYGSELAANFFTYSTLALPPSTTVATAVTSGTATAASTGGGLTDTGAAFGALAPTAALYYRVMITAGQGVGSSAIITANTATTITAPGLAATDATSQYEIQSVTGPLMSNTATAATTTTLTDTANTWTVNQFAPTAAGVSYQVRILSGSGAGQIGIITSNTANQLTVSPAFSAAPGVGATYIIEPALRNLPATASMLQVNTTLTGGTAVVKKSAASTVTQSLSIATAGAFDPIPLPAASVASLNNTGIIQGSLTLANTLASVVSYTAQGLATVNKNKEDFERLRHQTDQTYRNVVGVSVDTEMSNLVVLQNAYQASAQVLQTVRTMFDTLINLGRN